MELSDDDLYRIIKEQPSINLKIQQIIDADMYWIGVSAKKESSEM